MAGIYEVGGPGGIPTLANWVQTSRARTTPPALIRRCSLAAFSFSYAGAASRLSACASEILLLQRVRLRTGSRAALHS